MSEKIRQRLYSQNGIPAICIFCFLLGACFTLFAFRKDLAQLKEYVNVLQHQMQSTDISKERLFLYVLGKRLFLFVVVCFISKIIKSRYLNHIFTGLFSFAFGIFVFVNLMVIGVKGILSGVVLIVPQWIFYLIAYLTCIRENSRSRNLKTIGFIMIMITLSGIVVIGALLETYVTLPLINKIIF